MTQNDTTPGGSTSPNVPANPKEQAAERIIYICHNVKLGLKIVTLLISLIAVFTAQKIVNFLMVPNIIPNSNSYWFDVLLVLLMISIIYSLVRLIIQSYKAPSQEYLYRLNLNRLEKIKGIENARAILEQTKEKVKSVFRRKIERTEELLKLLETATLHINTASDEFIRHKSNPDAKEIESPLAIARSIIHSVQAALIQEKHRQRERKIINAAAFRTLFFHIVLFSAAYVVLLSDIPLNQISKFLQGSSEQTSGSNAEKKAAPNAEKAAAPNAEKTAAPNVEKTTAPNAEKTTASNAEKTAAPNAEKTTAPNAEKLKTLPLLNLPILVIMYSWIGSLISILRHILSAATEPKDDNIDYIRELTWFRARPVMGIGVGIIAYLVIYLGLGIASHVSNNSTSTTNEGPQVQLIMLCSLIAGLYDKPWESFFAWTWAKIFPSQGSQPSEEGGPTGNQPKDKRPLDK